MGSIEGPRGAGVQTVNPSGIGAALDGQWKSISLACVYTEADKGPAPAPAWDKRTQAQAQKMLELNLCKVEGGGRDGAENLY